MFFLVQKRNVNQTDEVIGIINVSWFSLSYIINVGLDCLDCIHFGFKELMKKTLLKNWTELTGPQILKLHKQELELAVTGVIKTLDWTCSAWKQCLRGSNSKFSLSHNESIVWNAGNPFSEILHCYHLFIPITHTIKYKKYIASWKIVNCIFKKDR